MGSEEWAAVLGTDLAAEPTLALLECAHRTKEVNLTKLGPVDVRKVQLAIGALPKQEAGKPIPAALLGRSHCARTPDQNSKSSKADGSKRVEGFEQSRKICSGGFVKNSERK